MNRGISKHTPRVSVVMPVYNAERYLPRTLDSLLRQTLSDLEIIAVDDGSTDRSGAICDDYATRDSRIHVIHIPNGGVSAARNRGIDEAAGEFVLFCDSDDTVEPTWAEQLSTDQPGLAVCGLCCIYPSQGNREVHTDWSTIPAGDAPLSVFWLLQEQGAMLHSCNKGYRRELLNRYGLRFDPTLAYCEDEQFVLNYLLHVEGGIHVVQADLYRYEKEHEGGLTHRYVPRMWDTLCRSFALREQVLARAELPISDIRAGYQTFMNWRVRQALANLDAADCPLTERERRVETRRILKSSVCREAFADGNFTDTPGWYVRVLKTRRAWLIRSVNRMIRYKNRGK